MRTRELRASSLRSGSSSRGGLDEIERPTIFHRAAIRALEYYEFMKKQAHSLRSHRGFFLSFVPCVRERMYFISRTRPSFVTKTFRPSDPLLPVLLLHLSVRKLACKRRVADGKGGKKKKERRSGLRSMYTHVGAIVEQMKSVRSNL